MWKNRMLEKLGGSGGGYDQKLHLSPSHSVFQAGMAKLRDLQSLEPPALKHKVHS